MAPVGVQAEVLDGTSKSLSTQPGVGHNGFIQANEPGSTATLDSKWCFK